ncbi:TonB-system energizer ExbB [Helicobacter monodelphidis]|uniref:TonB-system energizer ExbB n=1 Tax=Helicobacter sp. 15-1451 TaxID=2004995 RepID=UPI000DCC1F8B|nr:TonB-system energizer ExbB [Helicobacter sp. 15-1451]RAX58123.1 TonB-system energizer ExbB [Helicobacter sp. 15-1451]
MEFYLKEIVDYGVLGLLGIMSVVALAIVFERISFYRSIQLESFSQKGTLEIALSKHLTLLSSIATNAPYVGLLGTVFGVMLTFVQVHQNSSNSEEVMLGLALALKATAFGLLVAIPSLFCYNLLVRKSEVILTEWEVLNKRD